MLTKDNVGLYGIYVKGFELEVFEGFVETFSIDLDVYIPSQVHSMSQDYPYLEYTQTLGWNLVRDTFKEVL